jgi:hypothetical protein
MNINRNDELFVQNLLKKTKSKMANYNCGDGDYNKFIVNDIIYDEQKRLVSVFKEYLLWDETSDFLRR